jgi:hypothetical protein
MKQRLPKVQDTRPHRDAGHQTEVVKRLAASGVQESKTPASAGVLVLDGPSTQVKSFYAKAHSVQDTAVYNEYTAGQAVAQSQRPVNAKTSQIQPVCYSSTAMPEFNDRLRTDAQLARTQAQKNAYQRGYAIANCCIVCGEPPQFDRGCACSLTVAQQVRLPTSVSQPRVPS